jgi:hypothetical protein
MARKSSQTIDDTLLKALAIGATVESAARKAEVSERTVYRRLADSKFRWRLTSLRNEMVERTAGMLTGGGLSAVKTLVDLQQDAAVNAHVRRRAARDVLELGIKLRETADLEQRIAALEERAVKATASQPSSETGGNEAC